MTHSNSWIIQANLSIKLGKTRVKCFTKCQNQYPKSKLQIYNLWISQPKYGRLLLDFLSNLWISTAKLKQITQISTGFSYPTFGYLQTNSRFLALHRLLMDFFIQPLDIYSENKANYQGHYWIILSNIWISTDKFNIYCCFTQASLGSFYPTFG